MRKFMYPNWSDYQYFGDECRFQLWNHNEETLFISFGTLYFIGCCF